LLGYGDVRIYGLDQVRVMVEQAGLEIVTLEKRGFMRLHCVARKPMAEKL